jgi:hypothetical protein
MQVTASAELKSFQTALATRSLTPRSGGLEFAGGKAAN